MDTTHRNLHRIKPHLQGLKSLRPKAAKPDRNRSSVKGHDPAEQNFFYGVGFAGCFKIPEKA